MRIALINENSQAAKNNVIEKALKNAVEGKGFTIDNYGMYTAEDEAQLTYVQVGILAAVLLNSGAADYVITGCGTGRELERNLVKGALSEEKFSELFFANCKDEKIAECVKEILNK